LASGIKRTDRRWKLGHEGTIRQTGALRDLSFADLSIPATVMTANLAGRCPAPISTGPLWEALMAALAIPGLYSPWVRGGQRLVDAVTLTPVPLGSVVEAGADIIPATDIEDVIVKSVNEHLVAQHYQPSFSTAHTEDRGVIAKQVIRIDVHKDRLIVRFKSAGTDEGSHSTDGQMLSIPWQKPPSRKSRQILIPLGVPRNEVRPTRIERRARLVSAISRGRRWLDEIVSDSAKNIEQIAIRQKCSVRQVNMTISLAFLAPDLVKAAVEGRPRLARAADGARRVFAAMWSAPVRLRAPAADAVKQLDPVPRLQRRDRGAGC
jgi:predicted acylesterase/phospholipase RssA